MPTLKANAVLNLTLLVSATMVSMQVTALHAAYQSSASTSSALSHALAWLSSHQQSDGSYGASSEVQAAPAAYSLWLNNSSAPKARATFEWLASEFDNETSNIWAYPEADIAGEALYVLAATTNLGLLTKSSADYQRLGALQDSNGGFKGWYEGSVQVASSVDTAMALWGLLKAGAISSSDKQRAVNYLFQLQESGGRFNLTSTTASSPYSSLGPEPVALTAVVLLVLRDAGFTASDPYVSTGLSYLSQAAAGNFGGHVFAASMSALAFQALGQSQEASVAISFVVSAQNQDGGFRDTIRLSPDSNALDTGWASAALQLVQVQASPVPPVSGTPGSRIFLLIGMGIFAVLLVSIFAFLWRRRRIGARRAL